MNSNIAFENLQNLAPCLQALPLTISLFSKSQSQANLTPCLLSKHKSSIVPHSPYSLSTWNALLSLFAVLQSPSHHSFSRLSVFLSINPRWFHSLRTFEPPRYTTAIMLSGPLMLLFVPVMHVQVTLNYFLNQNKILGDYELVLQFMNLPSPLWLLVLTYTSVNDQIGWFILNSTQMSSIHNM